MIQSSKLQAVVVPRENYLAAHLDCLARAEQGACSVVFIEGQEALAAQWEAAGSLVDGLLVLARHRALLLSSGP